ncbi:MAG: hypothetical protein ACK5RL_03590 [Acidimicrobiales bacterium]
MIGTSLALLATTDVLGGGPLRVVLGAVAVVAAVAGSVGLGMNIGEAS